MAAGDANLFNNFSCHTLYDLGPVPEMTWFGGMTVSVLSCKNDPLGAGFGYSGNSTQACQQCCECVDHIINPSNPDSITGNNYDDWSRFEDFWVGKVNENCWNYCQIYTGQDNVYGGVDICPVAY
jgi:hypothetical protein